MNLQIRDAFADTAFWIALVVKHDKFNARAEALPMRLAGRIITTSAVLAETANALARPPTRAGVIKLIDRLRNREDVDVVDVSPALWNRAWELYCSRDDKSWSLTDCISILVMQDNGLSEALTTDQHFEQAGFSALLKL